MVKAPHFHCRGCGFDPWWGTKIPHAVQYLELRNLALFCVWEDARAWAHWDHSFDIHLSYLGPVSCVFTSWVSTGLTLGSGCSLMAARWQAFFVSFLSSFRAHPLTLHGCSHWWLWYPLFTDMAGKIPFFNHFASCKFWYVVFSFSLVSKYFLIALEISSLTLWLRECCLGSSSRKKKKKKSVLLNFHKLVIFSSVTDF